MDAIDVAVGLTADDQLYVLRRQRPEFVEGAALCRSAVLEPAQDLGLSPGLRAALARRMAMLNADAPLAWQYQAQLAELAPDSTLLALSNGDKDLPEPLATIARHSDFVTLNPAIATAEAIHLLAAAGLTTPQIVALAELIAFVNFQTRVTAGLRLMRSA